MLGAIIGDIVGSRWEFNPTNDYNFELFSSKNSFTDDTICTVAVADAILHGSEDFGKYIHSWCHRYPHPMGGYGGRFAQWVKSDHPEPYGSWGNGSAMRVSPVAWAYSDRYNVLRLAELTASCTHNHPLGISGAQAVALAIRDCRQLHRTGICIGADEAKRHGLQEAIRHFGRSVDLKEERVQNRFDETCEGTVPVAFWIINQSRSFEDAIRRAISLGADADTLGAIVGSIAETIWAIPEWMKKKALSYLPEEMRDVVRAFRTYVRSHTKSSGWVIMSDEEIEALGNDFGVDEMSKKRNLMTVARIWHDVGWSDARTVPEEIVDPCVTCCHPGGNGVCRFGSSSRKARRLTHCPTYLPEPKWLP